MTRNAKQITTLEELVDAALIETDERFKIERDTREEYDDDEAGDKWIDGKEDFCGKYPMWGTPEYAVYRAKEREYETMRPSRHEVVTYNLRRDYSTKYVLNAEIGGLVYAAWTKKEKYNRVEPIGTMTIAGMLKRLGRTDVSDKIKDAEKKQREAQEIRGRNYLRETLNKKLQDIEEWVNKNGAQIGVTAEMFQLPVELADKLKAENA